MKPKTLGFKGETLAAQYLQSKGYEILENNFTRRGGEIDLVAKKSGLFIFVEVKTRTGEQFGTGEESLNHTKKLHLKRAIARWLAEKNKTEDADYRVDMVSVMLNARTHALGNIEHLEDIEI